MKKTYSAVIGALSTGMLFLAEIILLKVYDVAPIGAGGTYIGFSKINGKVHEILGVHMAWYKITEYIGYAALALCVCFALVGLRQLIRRRSLFKVDREILALGGLFVLDILFYVLFEKLIVNYRPILMDGSTEPEASFPSSHTVLILCVMMAVFIIADHYVGKTTASLIKIGCVVISIVTVLGRLYCGAHWLTDIIGGILLSATLLFIFDLVILTGEYDAESFYEDPRDFYGEDEDEEDEEEYDEEDGEYYDDEEYEEGEYEDEEEYDEDGEYYDDDGYEDAPQYTAARVYKDEAYRGKYYDEDEKVDLYQSALYSDPAEDDERFTVAGTDAFSLEDLFDEEDEEEGEYEYDGSEYEEEEAEPISYVSKHSEPEDTELEYDGWYEDEEPEDGFDSSERYGRSRRYSEEDEDEEYNSKH